MHDNLRNLSIETMDIVNLRLGEPFDPDDSSVEEPLTVLNGCPLVTRCLCVQMLGSCMGDLDAVGIGNGRVDTDLRGGGYFFLTMRRSGVPVNW